jgi:hypothetical protein
MQSIQLATLDVEGLRTRLRKMCEELRKFGKAAQYMTSPAANMGKPIGMARLALMDASKGDSRTALVQKFRVSPCSEFSLFTAALAAASLAWEPP